MDQLQKLFGQFAPLRHPESWVTTTGLFAFILAAGGLAELLLTTFDASKPWQLAGVTGTVVLTSVAWWVGRSIYWRTGRGRRVGISYEGFRIPIDDWAETRKQLSLLCEGLEREERVQLKLLPSWMTDNETRWKRYEKRLQLPLILRATMTPITGKADESELVVTLRATFGSKMTADLLQEVNRNFHVLCRHKKVGTLRETLKLRADSLFDAILLYQSVIDYTQRRLESASRFFKRLDERLAEKFPPNVEPRSNIRAWRSHCLGLPSAFPGCDPPQAEELMQTVLLCQEAADLYGSEQPWVYGLLSRDYVYMGNLPAALAANEKAIAAAGDGTDVLHVASFILNRAVLNLFSGNDSAAVTDFSGLVATNLISLFDWNDLIGFADFMYGYGYAEAIYLRGLYRKLVGLKVPKRLDDQITSWLATKPADSPLAALYQSQQQRIRLPAPPNVPKTKPAAKRKSPRVTKKSKR